MLLHGSRAFRRHHPLLLRNDTLKAQSPKTHQSRSCLESYTGSSDCLLLVAGSVESKSFRVLGVDTESAKETRSTWMPLSSRSAWLRGEGFCRWGATTPNTTLQASFGFRLSVGMAPNLSWRSSAWLLGN